MAASRGTARTPAGRRPETATRRISPYETLKQAILTGELEPGQPLVETALAEWCQVSRTPIREALTRLEQDGLVDRSDRGMIVRMRSPEEILDVYETRLVLEATAGRMAAERRTPHDLRLLQRLLQRGEEVDTDDPAAMVEQNRQFHRAVWRASHNESLIDLLERLNLHLARYHETTLSYPGRWAEAKKQHALLVDAIDKRDGELAHDIALQHFTDARDIRLVQYGEQLP